LKAISEFADTSCVEAIADIALALEFGPERTSPVSYVVMGVTRLGLKCDNLQTLGRLGIWIPLRRRELMLHSSSSHANLPA
jgi:hypothetical protein